MAKNTPLRVPTDLQGLPGILQRYADNINNRLAALESSTGSTTSVASSSSAIIQASPVSYSNDNVLNQDVVPILPAPSATQFYVAHKALVIFQPVTEYTIGGGSAFYSFDIHGYSADATSVLASPQPSIVVVPTDLDNVNGNIPYNHNLVNVLGQPLQFTVSKSGFTTITGGDSGNKMTIVVWYSLVNT